jgi:hypothetical protein
MNPTPIQAAGAKIAFGVVLVLLSVLWKIVSRTAISLRDPFPLGVLLGAGLITLGARGVWKAKRNQR